jgi:putative transposase
MSRNYYSEINLHFVWHTKNSAPLLTPTVEPVAHRCIRKRIVDFGGVFVHEIGGTDNHVHIAVTVDPTITPSEFIGQIKGGSSHDVNHQPDAHCKLLEWQTGYGVVSFGTKDLAWVVRYIRKQREHHQRDRVFERLERIIYDDEGRRVSEEGRKPV